jgi:hypothetical protein
VMRGIAAAAAAAVNGLTRVKNNEEKQETK